MYLSEASGEADDDVKTDDVSSRKQNAACHAPASAAAARWSRAPASLRAIRHSPHASHTAGASALQHRSWLSSAPRWQSTCSRVRSCLTARLPPRPPPPPQDYEFNEGGEQEDSEEEEGPDAYGDANSRGACAGRGLCRLGSTGRGPAQPPKQVHGPQWFTLVRRSQPASLLAHQVALHATPLLCNPRRRQPCIVPRQACL